MKQSNSNSNFDFDFKSQSQSQFQSDATIPTIQDELYHRLLRRGGSSGGSSRKSGSSGGGGGGSSSSEICKSNYTYINPITLINTNIISEISCEDSPGCKTKSTYICNDVVYTRISGESCGCTDNSECLNLFNVCGLKGENGRNPCFGKCFLNTNGIIITVFGVFFGLIIAIIANSGTKSSSVSPGTNELDNNYNKYTNNIKTNGNGNNDKDKDNIEGRPDVDVEQELQNMDKTGDSKTVPVPVSVPVPVPVLVSVPIVEAVVVVDDGYKK